MFARKPAGKVIGVKSGSDNVEVEEGFSALERARHFGNSKLSLQRLVFVNELVDCAHDIGYEATVQHLLPLVMKLADDAEVLVRQSLVGHFGDLAGFLIQSDPERGYQKVVDDILPIVSVLLAEKASEVRQAAADALTTLASHLRPSERGYQVLKTAISMSQNNEDEDARGTAVQLLNGLAEALGQELCQQFVGIELVSLCEDPAFRVRKATAANFAEVSRVLGDEYVTRRLLPAFGSLVHDPHWGVRKAAAESLVGLAMALKAEVRQEPFVPLMTDMLKDSSRWVRMSALQQLGYFIAALEERERVPPELLVQYVEIIEQTKANPDAADVSYHCAYTFAAVVKTMGASHWAQLRGPFVSLCHDTQLKTRKAMAASMHIAAQTLGAEATERDVLTQFEGLLQDATPEVRAAALRNVANILRVLPGGDAQRRLLKTMSSGASGKQENWRLRQLMAAQISEVCEVLAAADKSSQSKETGKDSAWTFVVPLFLGLCIDDVAEVRDEAAKAIVNVLRAAAPELFADPGTGEGSSGCSSTKAPLTPQTSRLVRHLIRTFARGKTFRHRMQYIRMCDPIIRESPPHVFKDLFLHPLLRLTSDPVKNVRLCWAITLGPHVRKQGRLGQHPTLLSTAHKLRDFGDKEVRRVLEAAPIGDLPEGAEVPDLGPESDLGESDPGESWLASSEGGTGDSSECSVGDDDDGGRQARDGSAAAAKGQAAKAAKAPTGDGRHASASGTGASPLGFAPPPRGQGGAPAAPPLESLEAFTSGVSSTAPAAAAGSKAPAAPRAPSAAAVPASASAATAPTAPALGSSPGRQASPSSSTSPLMAGIAAASDEDRRATFDPVEDFLVQQKDMDTQQDSEFSSHRRLLQEAQKEFAHRPEALEAPEGPAPQEELSDEEPEVTPTRSVEDFLASSSAHPVASLIAGAVAESQGEAAPGS